MFSKACEYGIRATIYIGQVASSEKRVSLKAVAHAIDSPVAFTAKILQDLAREGVVYSAKGVSGGYYIPDNCMDDIRLMDIVKAIDGDQIYNGCGLGLKHCNDARPCPLHYQFAAVRDNLKELLHCTSIRELTNGYVEGAYFLKS